MSAGIPSAICNISDEALVSDKPLSKLCVLLLKANMSGVLKASQSREHVCQGFGYDLTDFTHVPAAVLACPFSHQAMQGSLACGWLGLIAI